MINYRDLSGYRWASLVVCCSDGHLVRCSVAESPVMLSSLLHVVLSSTNSQSFVTQSTLLLWRRSTRTGNFTCTGNITCTGEVTCMTTLTCVTRSFRRCDQWHLEVKRGAEGQKYYVGMEVQLHQKWGFFPVFRLGKPSVCSGAL